MTWLSCWDPKVPRLFQKVFLLLFCGVLFLLAKISRILGLPSPSDSYLTRDMPHDVLPFYAFHMVHTC